MAQRVVAAKDDMQTTDGADEGGLQNLYSAVDDLKNLMCDQKPETRLKERFRKDSGIDPEVGRPSLITEYRRIQTDSNKLLHRVSKTRIKVSEVHSHYDDVIDTLAMIFLPSARLARIERLAKLSTPQKSDLNELKRIRKNAYGFDHFASKMSSPAWFDMMESDMLKSPSGDPPWMLGSLAEHLKDAHVDAFVSMLEKNFGRWVSDDAGLGELGFVGYKLGDRGLPWLAKTLRRSKKVRMERDRKIKTRLEANPPDPKLIEEIDRVGNSIWHLDNYARRAFLDIKQPNPEFVELAECLLNSDSTVDNHYKTNDIPAKLVEGMGRASAIRIVEILVRELRAGLENRPYIRIPRLDLVNEPDYDRSDGINGLVASLCGALTKFRDLGVSTSQLIDLLDKLPESGRSRFEAWLYLIADDVADSVIVRYVIDACGSRYSNYEDGLLLDRLEQNGHMGDIVWRVSVLLGSAPDAEKIVTWPRLLGIDREELRRLSWAHALKRRVKLPDAWRQFLDAVNKPHEAEHDAGSGQSLEASGSQDGATLLDGLDADDPLEVARKLSAVNPDVGGFPELTGGHSPVSDLETMVRRNVSKWADDPVGIIREFQHPAYVAGYFRGLTGAEEDLAPYADQIIHAVKSARTLQWDGGASGSSTFYHAGELVSVDMAGMKLIEKMVKNNVSLGEDSLADVWSVVTDAIICPDPETGEQLDCSVEYLHMVDGLPHVRAVSTLFEVIRYAKRNDAEVPKMALARITKAIRLTGKYGVDYHACIGPEALLMHWLDPDWFEQNEQYLFGSAASSELGRVALDMHLMQIRPAEFILVKYRDMVLDAVKRDVHMALHHLLGCLLYGTRGYDPEYVAKSLMKIGPEYVSKTGWHIFRLLGKGAGADHVRRSMAFWASVLEQSPKPEALTGFGWWASVPGIDQKRWEELMLRTCELAELLDWSQEVAKRISTSETITDAGWRILARLISICLGSDKYGVVKYAMDALRKTVDDADAPESRSHLRNVLLEHNVHDAAKY